MKRQHKIRARRDCPIIYNLDSIRQACWGHFLAEMDRTLKRLVKERVGMEFQLGHFLAEMDRAAILGLLQLSK